MSKPIQDPDRYRTIRPDTLRINAERRQMRDQDAALKDSASVLLRGHVSPFRWKKYEDIRIQQNELSERYDAKTDTVKQQRRPTTAVNKKATYRT